MLGSILRTGFVRDVRFSGRVTFAWIPHAIGGRRVYAGSLFARGGFLVFSIRFLLFAAGDEVTFVFVGFAIWNQNSNRAIDEHRLARRQEHLRGAC